MTRARILPVFHSVVGGGLRGEIWAAIHFINESTEPYTWRTLTAEKPGGRFSPIVVTPSRSAARFGDPGRPISRGSRSWGPQPALRQRAGPARPPVTPSVPTAPPCPGARMLWTSPPCVTEWPRTPRQTLTCRGGAGRGGAGSGAQDCGVEQSWAAGRAWPGQRSGHVGRVGANMRFWHIGGEPAVRGRSRGGRAERAAARPVLREPAGPGGCLRPRWVEQGPGFGATSPGATVPTALTASSPPWSDAWRTRGPCKRASAAASGGCAGVRGWGEGWRGRRPGRGTSGRALVA